jgi:integration host factor subunit alpha
MSITKAHLVDSIHDKLGLPKNQSIQAVESILDTIKTTLASGEDVMITGFGKFYVKEKGERRGRNPATGEDLMLGSRKVVGFKCSGKLRERMNGEGKS